MKKLFCLINVLFLLTGCTTSANNIKPKLNGISFNAEVSYYNEGFVCSVKIEENFDTVITILEPEEINGLKFKFSANDVIADFNGLNYKIDNNSPEQSVAEFIYNVFSNKSIAVTKDGDNLYIEGKTKSNQYKLFIAPTGLPLKITDPTQKYKIIIKNVIILS